MKNREEWPQLTPEEIDIEVEARFEMIGQMVGWLYPSILEGEIYDLRELKKEKQEAVLAEANAVTSFDDAKPV
jgi:hypothetical protein